MTKRRTISGMGELFAFGEETKPTVQPDIPPPDAEARAQALDTRRSWIVDAPAGSGKTGLLIQRYLKLLAQPEVAEPEQVLAITFTNKAAAEIRDRVVEQLESAPQRLPSDLDAEEFKRETRRLAEAVIERDTRRGWRLLEQPHRLNVRTIDSICAEIARSQPLLTGSSVLTPVDNAVPLHLVAAERALMQLAGSDQRLREALKLVLLHRDGNLADCRKLLAEMLSVRDQWGRLVPMREEHLKEDVLDDTVLRRLEDALKNAIAGELLRLEQIFPRPALEDLSALAREMAECAGYNGNASPIAVWSGRLTPPSATAEEIEFWQPLVDVITTGKGKNKEWRKGFNKNHIQFEITPDQKNRLNRIIDSLRSNNQLLEAIKTVAVLPSQHYPREQWEVAKALFHVLKRALIELQLVFAERGECDFTELALLAAAVLKENGGALDTALGAKLEHILVDEMQDTSTSQYELIELLTAGWDGRSQTVFLVGDPKQSIYLFRQARVERFIRTMQDGRLGGLTLGRLRLTANFRSQPSLVESFNRDFSLLFPREFDSDRPEEAPHVEAQPVREPVIDAAHTVWHAEGVPYHDETKDRRTARRKFSKIEARNIRKVIEQWRVRPLPVGRKPRTIAVLARNRSHLTQIIAEFKRSRGTGPIPFRAVDIEQLSERPEILDLFALTRALVHPADRVAWLSILRAPWAGLDLSDLHLLSSANHEDLAQHTITQLIHERGQELSERGIAVLQQIWPVLGAALRQRSRIPLSELVERTWRSLRGDSYLSTEEKENARRYFELLDEAEHQDTAIDLKMLKQRLEKLYAAPSTAENAVDLMTIHGAKGLEWDVVLVPGLEKRTRASGYRMLDWEELTPKGYDAEIVLAPIIGKGADSEALNEWLRRLRQRREEAETKRLFYVACTRAREELHLFATPQLKSDQSVWHAYGSLLQAAWPAAKTHFANNNATTHRPSAPVIAFPLADSERVVETIAAASQDEDKPAILYRLPLNVRPPRSISSVAEATSRDRRLLTARFDRPEGSFESRAFGNAVHAFLELVANELAGGIAAGQLLSQLTSWQPRIHAVLRSYGLAPSTVERLASRVEHALDTTLHDPHGLWILTAHADAQSEHALTSWHQERTSVRLDRIFSAGESPLTTGTSHLWIVDFKTASHSDSEVDGFLKREQEKYHTQMAAYARIMQPAANGRPLRLGLYYPMLPRLQWWIPEEP